MKTLQKQRQYNSQRDSYRRKVEHEQLDGYGWIMSLDSVRTPEEILLIKERFARLERHIDNLPPRIGRVMRLRLGINCKAHTFEEIAQQYNVTRECIRQMENRGLRIIKRRIWIEEKPEDYRRQQEATAKAYTERRRLERETELAEIKADAAAERAAAEERVAMDAERRQVRAYGAPVGIFRLRAVDGKFTSILPNRYRAPPQPRERTILDDIVKEQHRALKLEREYTRWATERAKWLRSPLPEWAQHESTYAYKMRRVEPRPRKVERDWLNVATEGFRDGA